jgi:hypothetical protein
VHPCGSAWIMGGGVPMNTVAATVGLDWSGKFDGGRAPTLAEWSRLHAPSVFKGGQAFESDGLRVEARKFRRKKLMEATVSATGQGATGIPCDPPAEKGEKRG